MSRDRESINVQLNAKGLLGVARCELCFRVSNFAITLSRVAYHNLYVSMLPVVRNHLDDIVENSTAAPLGKASATHA